MSQHDPGVTDLLRRASDDLTPDVHRLVAGGIDRGRSRQRRARIGTTVASLAVIGVVGGLAAVVPLFVPDAPVASDAPGPSAGSGYPDGRLTPAPGPTPLVPAPAPVDLAVKVRDIPGEVARILGRADVSAPLAGVPDAPVSGPQQRIVHFRIDGMITSVYITRAEPTEEVDPAEGVVWDQWASEPDDAIQALGVSVYRDGYNVALTAYNSSDRSDPSTVVQAEPVLDVSEMLDVAKSEVWFKPRA